ncbi:hypothetical protein K505DRAFT_258065 [Melanomma pulvis-pyrius CBS 109.77]|uniref:Aminoglycoside phosphotransferase domain-containing protein n=1 Tax=Melanomma pulvis-pyrius CBS 109.77 TaxID=1314802 RepID=A0A6A6WT21_9PLEO|nr:hypothetical protein K505DRAFT_258065 [Melanomma pulvis-pyrius CBS 109.77]
MEVDEDDSSSETSETSTIEHEQEPYFTFKDRARQLALDLFHGHKPEDIVIERMDGGSFNRIIGVTVFRPKPQLTTFKRVYRALANCFSKRKTTTVRPSERYILRIPRQDASTMDYDVTTLLYTAHHVPHPVPTVFAHDMSSDNALGMGYMLQHRMPGQTLVDLWQTLNFEQRKCAMRRVTEIVLDLHNTTSTSAGIISRANNSVDITGRIKIEPYPVSGRLASTTNGVQCPLSIPQTTRDHLLGLCKAQRPVKVADDGTLLFQYIWDDFESIINTLYEKGFIPDHHIFHLCHLDLQSRNLLARVVDESTIEITGILDWDSAAFAPKFLSVRAPFFFWTEDDAWEEDEADVYRPLSDPEHIALKAVYEEVAGPQFSQTSYIPELALARRMYYILKRGLYSGIQVQFAEDIIEEFAKLNIK